MNRFTHALSTMLVFPVLALFSQYAHAVTIDTVPIGNPGNADDPYTDNHYGGVGYEYRIGKYEVTLGQYTSFLNAVAKTDTYGLYSTRMATDLNSRGIMLSGSSGNYTYSVIGSPNHPVTHVSWGDAARFANWLHNGQPTGPQNSTTTEDGAYTLNGATSYWDVYAVTRNAVAKWFIPSENEWYKAAYYQPAAQGGDADGYWLYPMKTNSQPYSDQPPGDTPDNTRVGNFSNDDGVANGYDAGFAANGQSPYYENVNYLTDVGAYASSPSYYGTFDQGGNVWEWNENQGGNFVRGTRGGAWAGGYSGLQSVLSTNEFVNLEDNDYGFRVATIPDLPGDFNHDGTVDAADYVV